MSGGWSTLSIIIFALHVGAQTGAISFLRSFYHFLLVLVDVCHSSAHRQCNHWWGDGCKVALWGTNAVGLLWLELTGNISQTFPLLPLSTGYYFVWLSLFSGRS